MASKERQCVLFGNGNEYHNSLELVQEQYSNMQIQMQIQMQMQSSSSSSIMSPTGPLSYFISDAASSSNYSISPMGSDIGLPENQDDILAHAELTRRMAEFTFEDDDRQQDDDYFYEATGGCGVNKSSNRVYDYNHAFISASKQHSTPHSAPPQNATADIFSFQKNCMTNKPQMRKEGSERSGAGGRGVKTTAEQKEHRHRQSHSNNNNSNMQDIKAWKYSGSGRNGSLIIPDMPPALPGCGSGEREVFMGGSKVNSVSNGTGVFLPSATYRKADRPKKPAGCSTAIIPARVLQTLQQHFTNVGAQSQSQNSDSSINHHWQNDVLARINGLLSQNQEQAVFQIHPPPPAATIHDQEELRLPRDWTY